MVFFLIAYDVSVFVVYKGTPPSSPPVHLESLCSPSVKDRNPHLCSFLGYLLSYFLTYLPTTKSANIILLLSHEDPVLNVRPRNLFSNPGMNLFGTYDTIPRS